MAVITLVSASGSPGVTTTAVGLAMTWPRPVLLVEADPTGGSGILAGYFRGLRDHRGLVDLVMAHRSGLLADALPRIVLRVDGTDVSILVGSKSHDQAPGLSRLWEPLAGVLLDVSAAGQDVLVDAGRLGLASWPRPLAAHSDLTVLMSRSSLPGLVAARSWAATLADDVLPGHEARLLIVGRVAPTVPQRRLAHSACRYWARSTGIRSEHRCSAMAQRNRDLDLVVSHRRIVPSSIPAIWRASGQSARRSARSPVARHAMRCCAG